MTSLPLARVFQCLFTFAFVSASRWLGEIWRLSRRGATGELEVEFKFQRRSCKLSFLFSPPLPDPLAWRACSQVNDSPIVLYPTAINREEVITSRSHGSKLSGWQQTVSVTKKTWIRTVKNFIDLIHFHSVCRIGEIIFLGLNPKGPHLRLEKEKENFCVVFTNSIKPKSGRVKLGSFISQSCNDGYKKAWCTCKVLVLLI